eukprot:271057-Amphidinium_carterae.1
MERTSPNNMTQRYIDVPANYVIYMFYRLTSQFRMVAEQRVHHQRAGHHQGPVRERLHEVQQQTDQELLPDF